MPNPLEDVENRKAQQDIGALGLRVYEGARIDGASRLHALLVTVAFFRAVIHGGDDAPEFGEAD